MLTLLFVVVSAAAIMLGLRRRSSHRSPHRSMRSFCSCFCACVSLELLFHLYSVIVVIIMFVYVSTLFVVVNLDALAVRKTLFEGFSSSPHDASLHSCLV